MRVGPTASSSYDRSSGSQSELVVPYTIILCPPGAAVCDDTVLG
jgi:hypothetical protein